MHVQRGSGIAWIPWLDADDQTSQPRRPSQNGPVNHCLRSRAPQPQRAASQQPPIRWCLTQAAGTTIRLIDPQETASELTCIAVAWARAKGGERGFSMGRYHPDFLRGQMVYGIYVDDMLRGFVSFQVGPDDWVLDLIRYDGTLPAGAIHAAMVAGFEAAKIAGVAEVNLGAAVAQRGPLGWLGRRHAGLQQFKGSFAPHTRPLYHAASGRLSFVWFAATVLLAVQRPHGRLTPWIGQLFLSPSHAPQEANLRTGPIAQTDVPDDKRTRPMSRRARLDLRRWRNQDTPFQYGSFFRRRARDVQRRTF